MGAHRLTASNSFGFDGQKLNSMAAQKFTRSNSFGSDGNS